MIKRDRWLLNLNDSHSHLHKESDGLRGGMRATKRSKRPGWRLVGISIVVLAGSIVYAVPTGVGAPPAPNRENVCASAPDTARSLVATDAQELDLASIERVAANIKAAGGIPTQQGRAFLNAAATHDTSAVSSFAAANRAGTSADGSIVVMKVATNVRSMVVNPNIAPNAVRTMSGVIGPRRTGRSLGSAIWYPGCGPWFTANAIWYCKQGSSRCSATAVFQPSGFTSSEAGGCSIVNVSPCQIYTRTTPPPGGSVLNVQIYQSASGTPVWGDRWCSW